MTHTEKPQKIAPIKQFNTLEEFIKGQNNFYMHFVNTGWVGPIYRTMPHFKRFQKANPDLEESITNEVAYVHNQKPKQKLPYDRLWDAYKIMTNYVYAEDENENWPVTEDALIR